MKKLCYPSSHITGNSRYETISNAMEKAVRKSTLFHEKTSPLVIFLVVASMVTHNTGSVTGKERIVKREPRPPDWDTMAAMMVVADVMAIPPASIVIQNCNG